MMSRSGRSYFKLEVGHEANGVEDQRGIADECARIMVSI
jgi:hypothetical protein